MRLLAAMVMGGALCGGLVGGGLVGGLGCQSTPAGPVEPATMNDAEAPMRDRRLAVRQAGEGLDAGTVEIEPTREALKTVIWRRANYWKLRAEALDALLADEANLADTRTMLTLLLPTESVLGAQEMIEVVGEEAARRGWTDLTPGFVVSLSHPVLGVEDEDRAEYGALRELHPRRDPVDVVFDVFAGRFENLELRERDRLAAWGLLRRLDPSGERTRDLLAELEAVAPGDDPLLVSLRASARDLRAVPDTGEQLEWVGKLREPEHRAFWAESARVIAGLSGEQLRGFELRHVSGVRWASAHRPELLGADRRALLDEVERRVEANPHHWRSGGSSTQVDEALRRARDELVWGDLLLMLIALEAMEDGSLAGEMFAQAEKDMGDTSTEHGGVLDAREDSPDASARFVAWSYPPRPSQRLGDNRFVASDDLLNAGVAALFHYHFHATTYANRKYAGPSLADLEYARRYGRSCLVLTFVDRDTLNVDYYQPDGARVDLGVIERP